MFEILLYQTSKSVLISQNVRNVPFSCPQRYERVNFETNTNTGYETNQYSSLYNKRKYQAYGKNKLFIDYCRDLKFQEDQIFLHVIANLVF